MSTKPYRTLGRSGLKVSPFCLGTMTFGEDWGWGSSKDAAREIFNFFIEHGGNFIDTADGYVNGQSEEMLGAFIKESNTRDQIVLATKYTFNAQPGNPNAGGNGLKNLYRAIQGSLKRMQTDYIDLYWLHAWDRSTPVEEVLYAMNDLIRVGKIRYFGLSDVPAWYAAKMHTLAQAHGLHAPVAMQLEYSLLERSIEYEFVDMAAECSMGITPWSPLASGMLTGKYDKDDLKNGGRLSAIKDMKNESFAKLFTDRNWKITDVVKKVATRTGKSPAQVALNWLSHRPGVTSIIIGATKLNQLKDNLSSLDFIIDEAGLNELNEISAPPSIHPYVFFGDQMQSMISGGVQIEPWLAQAH